MAKSPFLRAGPVPPQSLCGRTDHLTGILDVVTNNGHAAIYGEPGVGKSSLLRCLGDRATWQKLKYDPSGYYFVDVDCLAIGTFTPTVFWGKVFEKLNQELPGAEKEALKDPLKAVQDKPTGGTLSGFFRALSDRQKRLLLLVDDFEEALRENKDYADADMSAFLYEMRALANDKHQALSVVVSTFRHLNVQGPKPTSPSPWYNQYLYYPVRNFSRDEVKTLFGLLPLLLSFPQYQQEALLEVAGTHPALLQIACHLLFAAREKGNVNQDGWRALVTEFQEQAQRYFHNSWRLSSKEERTLLMLTALVSLRGRLHGKRAYKVEGADRIFSQRQQELIGLQSRGILRLGKAPTDPPTFDSSMAELWVVQEIEKSGKEDLEAYEAVFGGLMSRAQQKQMIDLLKKVWEAKDTINEVAKWAGKLVNAFAQGLGVMPQVGGAVAPENA